jgi:hypothetical protein
MGLACLIFVQFVCYEDAYAEGVHHVVIFLKSSQTAHSSLSYLEETLT